MRRSGSAWRVAGATRAGLLVRLSLVVLLACILLERTLYYQEQVERSIMEATIVNIRSGMRWHIADLMTRHRSAEVALMLEQNPLRWLQQPPVDYVGTFDSASVGKIRGGSWYFDDVRRELVYVPRLKRFFSGAGGAQEVRFKVQAVAAGQDGSAGSAASVAGVDIAPARPYKWF